MDLNIKIIYEGKSTLRKFKYILAKTGLLLEDDGEYVRGWDGWMKIGEKTTPIKNACITCFLSNIGYILRKKENILIEIYLILNSF